MCPGAPNVHVRASACPRQDRTGHGIASHRMTRDHPAGIDPPPTGESFRESASTNRLRIYPTKPKKRQQASIAMHASRAGKATLDHDFTRPYLQCSPSFIVWKWQMGRGDLLHEVLARRSGATLSVPKRRPNGPSHGDEYHEFLPHWTLEDWKTDDEQASRRCEIEIGHKFYQPSW